MASYRNSIKIPYVLLSKRSVCFKSHQRLSSVSCVSLGNHNFGRIFVNKRYFAKTSADYEDEDEYYQRRRKMALRESITLPHAPDNEMKVDKDEDGYVIGLENKYQFKIPDKLAKDVMDKKKSDKEIQNKVKMEMKEDITKTAAKIASLKGYSLLQASYDFTNPKIDVLDIAAVKELRECFTEQWRQGIGNAKENIYFIHKVSNLQKQIEKHKKKKMFKGKAEENINKTIKDIYEGYIAGKNNDIVPINISRTLMNEYKMHYDFKAWPMYPMPMKKAFFNKACREIENLTSLKDELIPDWKDSKEFGALHSDSEKWNEILQELASPEIRRFEKNDAEEKLDDVTDEIKKVCPKKLKKLKKLDNVRDIIKKENIAKVEEYINNIKIKD